MCRYLDCNKYAICILDFITYMCNVGDFRSKRVAVIFAVILMCIRSVCRKTTYFLHHFESALKDLENTHGLASNTGSEIKCTLSYKIDAYIVR